MDLKQLLTQTPFHRWLGVELVRADEHEVEVYLPYREEFNGDDDAPHLHGGIIATLADIAACFAVISASGHDVPSIDLHVDFLRMAPCASLTAVGRAIKVGRTIGVADVEVRGEDGRVVAIARAKVATNAPGRDILTNKGS
jgi:uncharacterized protein (TIGR00369 family)